MHTAEHPRAAKRDAGAARAIRVAVAGATGYTGQELLRLLSRHPGVTITAATSSGATAARKLPALGHLFKGEITPLAAMVRPHVAIITTIAPVHLEYFESLDDIAAAKAEIFSGLVPGGEHHFNVRPGIV